MGYGIISLEKSIDEDGNGYELREALKNRDNINVMNKICSKYTEIICYEELQRCKLISLWEALKSYDPTKGKCKFTTFM